jgi:hypothetical protein
MKNSNVPVAATCPTCTAGAKYRPAYQEPEAMTGPVMMMTLPAELAKELSHESR